MPETASRKHAYLEIYIMCFCSYKPFNRYGLLSLTANLISNHVGVWMLDTSIHEPTPVRYQ